MKKRIFALVFAALLLFCACAQGAGAYPEQTGAVNDDAFVLSSDTAADIDALNAACEDIGMRFHVVTRHFLGGADAQNYCDGLFEAWRLSGDDALLLLVIGEERYALTVGTHVSGMLSNDKINSLLSTQLRAPFLNDRAYDQATGAFLLAMANEGARAANKTIKTAGLFGTQSDSAQAEASAQGAQSDSFSFSSLTGDWWSGFFSNESAAVAIQEENANAGAQSQKTEDQDDNSGFSIWKLVLILLVISYLSKRGRRVKRNPGPRPGAR